MPSVSLKRNKVVRLGTQLAVPVASTGQPIDVDVSTLSFASFFVFGSGGATSANDVDLFMNLFNAAGLAVSGSAFPQSRASGGISGGIASKLIQCDVRGVDMIRVFPRNNNATVALDMTADLLGA